MSDFNSPKLFGNFALWAIVSGVLAYQYVGWPVLVAVAVGLYYTLHFYSALDARDIRDRQQSRHARRRRRDR
jgi:hypothetical protein